MKLISLNTWGGRVHEPFVQFLKNHSASIDIFCFQEVNDDPQGVVSIEEGERRELFKEISEALPSHMGYFAPQVVGTGLAMFVKKELKVAKTDFKIVLAPEEIGEGAYPRTLQWVVFESGLSIYNLHGVPGRDKRDTPGRDLQTSRVLETLAKDPNEKVLVGDFNISPDTESIRRFERTMHNLVIERGYKTTRSNLYQQKNILPFADYAFVSQGVVVKDFKVLQDEVSDHLPLYLEIR